MTYGVIVDCGSSGTRAHIYQWKTAIGYPELLHKIEPMRDENMKPVTKKIKPGLSSLSDEPDKASEYITPILNFIVGKIPKSRQEFTAVYFMATAGMRLVEEQSQKAIMEDIATYVKNTYNFAKVSTHVISGAVEGMYQWISVNAKSKLFLGPDTGYKTRTYGVIEMGGASLQVTYQLRLGFSEAVQYTLPNDEIREIYRRQIVAPRICQSKEQGKKISLQSTTFLGFGSNSARSAYIDLLIKNHQNRWSLSNFPKKLFSSCFQCPAQASDTEMELDDPCLPKGYTSPPIEKPKLLLKQKGTFYGTIVDDDEPTFNVILKGTGKFWQCKSRVKRMLQLAREEKFNCKPNESCTMSLIGTDFVPFGRFNFLAIGDIYYTLNNDMINVKGQYDHKLVLNRARAICGTSYKKLQQMYPNVLATPEDNRLAHQCFKAIWVDTFLIQGLKMPRDYELPTVNDIKGDDLEWPLGAVLDKSFAIEQATEAASKDVEDEGEVKMQTETSLDTATEAATAMTTNSAVTV